MIAQRALDDLDSARLVFPIGERKIVIRDKVKSIFDFLTAFKSVIGGAVAADPSGSLAWTGVMAALPISYIPRTGHKTNFFLDQFLENIVKQDQSAAVGFERISSILVRYALIEKDLSNKKSENTMS